VRSFFLSKVKIINLDSKSSNIVLISKTKLETPPYGGGYEATKRIFLFFNIFNSFIKGLIMVIDFKL
jgi:hypothetical protein